jgi:hypothetical protein
LELLPDPDAMMSGRIVSQLEPEQALKTASMIDRMENCQKSSGWTLRGRWLYRAIYMANFLAVGLPIAYKVYLYLTNPSRSDGDSFQANCFDVHRQRVGPSRFGRSSCQVAVAVNESVANCFREYCKPNPSGFTDIMEHGSIIPTLECALYLFRSICEEKVRPEDTDLSQHFELFCAAPADHLNFLKESPLRLMYFPPKFFSFPPFTHFSFDCHEIEPFDASQGYEIYYALGAAGLIAAPLAHMLTKIEYRVLNAWRKSNDDRKIESAESTIDKIV